MLRYLFLYISCLLLLTACGDGLTDQAGGTVDDVGGDILSFLEQDNPKSCAGCDLANADLTGANLAWADLSLANLDDAWLIGANLDKANLTDVIGADFTGAVNVPERYRKD